MAVFTSTGGYVARSTQTEHEFLIGSEGEQAMVQPLWRNDRTFYLTIHMQAGFLVFARVSRVYDGMAHVELEVFADAWVEAHYIYVLDSVTFPRLIV